jgi:hypothetical protein
VLAGAPADDGDAHALAQGSATTFSVWYVGERTATQVLMCDRYERTRSWFRVVPLDGEGGSDEKFALSRDVDARRCDFNCRNVRAAVI